MKRAISYLAVLFAIALSSAASAESRAFPDAKLQITLPDGWKVKDAKNGITMAGAPADDAGLILFSQVNPTGPGVKKNVDDLIDHMHATNVVWEEKIGNDKVNGMPAFFRAGTATLDGKPHNLMCILVVNGSNGLVIVGVVQSDRKDTYTAALTATIKSITPVK